MWVDFFQTRPYLSLIQVLLIPLTNTYFDFPLYRIWRKNGQMARNNRHQWKGPIHKFCKWSLSHQTSKRFSHSKESSLNNLQRLPNDFFTSQYCHHIFSNFLKNSIIIFSFMITLWFLNVLLFFDKSLIQSIFPWEYVFKKSIKIY